MNVSPHWCNLILSRFWQRLTWFHQNIILFHPFFSSLLFANFYRATLFWIPFLILGEQKFRFLEIVFPSAVELLFKNMLNSNFKENILYKKNRIIIEIIALLDVAKYLQRYSNLHIISEKFSCIKYFMLRGVCFPIVMA